MTASIWFWEERLPTGRWAAVTAPDKPDTTGDGAALRLRRVSGLGRRLRCKPVKVAPRHATLDLNVLADLYAGPKNA